MKMLLNGIWTLSGENQDGKAVKIDAAVPGYVMPELEKRVFCRICFIVTTTKAIVG